MIFGKHINRYYIKYMPVLLLGIAALLMVDYFQLEIPALYNLVVTGVNEGAVEIDGVSMAFTMDVLLDEVCAPLIVVIIALVFGRFLWRICFFGSGIKVETAIRREMFDHCKELSQQYYQVNKVGNLMSLFTNDLETVQDCFGSGILMLCDAITIGAMAMYKMWRMDWSLTLLVLIPAALLMGVGVLVGNSLERKWDERQAAFSDLSDFSQESFSGIAVVKAFVKESKELWAFKKLNKKNEDTNVSFTRMSTLMHVFVTLAVESVVCIILGYGGFLVYKGTFKAGDLVEFVGYFTSIVWPVMAVAELIGMRARGKASLKRIGELLDAKEDVCDRENVTDVDSIRGDIEFRNMNFAYPDGDFDVLRDVSFKINAGENVGIIGKTGSGKTTIVDLILRTYNVPDGTLFVDGHDVNSIPIRTVRKHTAYVPQDNFLFSDTIRNNIAFASDSDSEELVTDAAKMSDVHGNIIDFPDGYATVLGERGVTVSGGQKQRISIARAIMKDASILILDDSVSAVDTKTEKIIIDNLRENRRGKTTILIAHRISTIEKMDKIIFIDDGSIAAIGTHEELISSCPDYRTMVELQKLEEEKGGEANA